MCIYIMSDTLLLPLSSNNQTQMLRNNSCIAPSKFCMPTKISDKLSVFLGIEKGTEMSRVNVSREINKYIRLHNLQDKQNKIIINPDNNISILFGLNNGDELTYFNIQKYIGQHLD
jgi:chromatin remodeling complex protein RSC6